MLPLLAAPGSLPRWKALIAAGESPVGEERAALPSPMLLR